MPLRAIFPSPRPTLVLLILLTCAPAQAAIVIDGRADEPEWEQAARYGDFKVTDPYRLSSPDPGMGTQARLQSTPEGIVVAFQVDQKAGVSRLKPRLERDQKREADRVNFMIDFDADGRTAYSFTVGLSGSIQDGVVTNERDLNLDWDTDWTWAVSEGENGWQVEMLIPWSVAPMRGIDQPNRTVAVYFGRVLGSTSERQAFPAVTTERSRFLSGFERLEIAQYRKSLFHFWPYLTARHDLIEGQTKYTAGLDVFWKPSPDFQLNATINPDFGQVESDDLVVNFDAIETFYSDKRPFFTENQGIFDLRTPDEGRLVHTRRIGGPADDGSGASDIDAAVKLIGSVGALGYGVLAASEDDEAGRDFYVARLQYPLSRGLNIGWLGTDVERPYLDRSAQVQAFDVSWRPNAKLIVNAQVLGSFIDQKQQRRDDTGAWTRINWIPSTNWSYELEATHFGRQLDFNDLGYQRRNSLNEVELTGEYVHRKYSQTSRLRSTRWNLELQARSNDRGDRLPTYLIFTNAFNFRSGNRVVLETSAITDGVDDLISRGNGLWRKSGRYGVQLDVLSRRYGDWSFNATAELIGRGVSARPAKVLTLIGNWYPSDAFNAEFEIGPEWTDDWLIWEGARNFGRYQRRVDFVGVNLSWFPGIRHELRLKSEWLAIQAEDGERYVLLANGRMQASGQARPNFDINNFGLQLRYRYLLGPQSDIFVAYSRGGAMRQERDQVGGGELFDEALQLRDSDQLLAKIRYRF
jgi:hypothetical protein